MTSQKDDKKELTTLDIVIIVISFLGFLGTIVNVGFAVRDHITLNKLQNQVARSPMA